MDIVFFPIVWDIPAHSPFVIINLIPFKSISEIYTHMPFSVFIKQVLGNVIIFLPLGFTIPFLYGKTISFKKLAMIIFIFSLSIETAQFLINILSAYPNRSSDIDDIILNVSGGTIGYFLQKLFCLILNKRFNYDFLQNVHQIGEDHSKSP
jgi:glycopeptide antibiotics resistance protein